MDNTNEIINWLSDFNTNHNKLFDKIDTKLMEQSAQELINETN